jgi:peptide deformylase
MAVVPIRLHPDPVLRERASEVGDVDAAIRKLVRDMEDTMRDAPGVGLAAPQVGVQRRVIVYDYGDGFNAVVNPEIVDRAGEIVDEEGCLSLPGLAFPVPRAQRIVVRGLDAEGRPVRYEAEDLHARVVQHEVDHLDGVLFIDRLDRETRKEAMRILRERALGVPGEPVGPPPIRL